MPRYLIKSTANWHQLKALGFIDYIEKCFQSMLKPNFKDQLKLMHSHSPTIRAYPLYPNCAGYKRSTWTANRSKHKRGPLGSLWNVPEMLKLSRISNGMEKKKNSSRHFICNLLYMLAQPVETGIWVFCKFSFDWDLQFIELSRWAPWKINPQV